MLGNAGGTSNRTKWLALGASAGVFLALSAVMWGFVVDDAFISLRYATHLAEGNGLVYNVGERVEGITNLLWTLMLAAALWAGGDAFAWMKALSIASGLLAAVGTAYLASRSGLLSAEWRWLPAMLWLLLPVTAIGAAEGLETMLFSALTVWALAATFAGSGPVTGLTLAALAFTRPDGLLVAPFAIVWLWRRNRVAGVQALAVVIVALSAVEAWRLAYYGEWLPNTFFAKRGGSWWLLGMGTRSLLAFSAVSGAGVWLLAWTVRNLPAARLLAGVVAARVAFHLWSGGPWMGEHRFLLPVLPLILILTSAGMVAVAKRPMLLVIPSVILLLPGWVLFPGRLHAIRTYADGLQTAYVSLGTLLDRSLPTSATIATGDAGALAYYSRRRVIDILGLNDHHIARRPGRFNFDKHDSGYVMSQAPAVIVLRSATTDARNWMAPADRGLASHPDFQSRYEPFGTWSLLPRYHLVAFRLRVSDPAR